MGIADRQTRKLRLLSSTVSSMNCAPSTCRCPRFGRTWPIQTVSRCRVNPHFQEALKAQGDGEGCRPAWRTKPLYDKVQRCASSMGGHGAVERINWQGTAQANRYGLMRRGTLGDKWRVSRSIRGCGWSMGETPGLGTGSIPVACALKEPSTKV